MSDCSICSDRFGNLGDTITLNTRFLKNGVPKDPYAIRAVRIYKGSVREENLVTEIVFPCPGETGYEDALEKYLRRVPDTSDVEIGECGTGPVGPCGTDLTASDIKYCEGLYLLDLCLSPEIFDTGVYFDVWCFIGDEEDLYDTNNDCTISPTEAAADVDCDNEDLWTCTCNRFYVREGGWHTSDDLESIRIGFEPLDTLYHQPEKRWLEVGMMPLPLYDFNYKKMAAIVPSLQATITIETQNNEVVVDEEKMCIGVRSGSYRTNPYVLKYLLDTTRFLKGTYRYQVTIHLPDGTTQVSSFFNLTIR
jgi:hypothetical protein